MLEHDKMWVVMTNSSGNIFQNLANYNITIGDQILLLVYNIMCKHHKLAPYKV